MNLFKQLGISESILKVIEESGFEKPTYIQEKTIPLILEGNDVIGQSSTGSGKTLALGCGIIDTLEPGRGLGALVMTPTRELCEQVSDVLKTFSKHKRLKVASIYGGVSINPQMDALKKADIAVATPGRILDHLNRQTIDLSQIKILVLDEADRMVDMGFIDDIRKIISACPKNRQTMLFTATLSPDIEKIKHDFMDQPQVIRASSHVDPKKLRQVYYDVKGNMKFSLLVKLLSEPQKGLALIFCNTRRQVDFIAKNLRLNNLNAIAIHGGFTQSKRSSNMDKFQNSKMDILICTDVAARGLDIKGVSHVYNYDIPANAKEYIHRIGRTARAGEEGLAVNLLSERDHENFGRIQREYSELKVERRDTGFIEKAKVKVETRRDRDGRDGSRGHSGKRRNSNQGNFRKPRRNRNNQRF